MKKLLFKTKNFLSENDIYNFGKNNKVLLLMFFCLIVGMTIGSISAGCINFETLDKLNSIFLTDFKQRISQNRVEVFVSSLSMYFIFALILEISALSVWGIVSVPILLVFKGMGMGLSGGYLYLVYGLKGIAFYILILVPGIFVSSIAFALFGVCAFKSSVAISKKILPNPSGDALWPCLKSNIKKLGYCTLLLCFSAFLDMAFMMMFSIFFEF